MNVKLSKSYLNCVKWLLKAVSTDKQRETLLCVRVVEPGMFEATDGWKIHRLTLNRVGGNCQEEIFDTLAAIEPGLYRIKIDGNFAVIEKPNEALSFPDTFAITVLNRKLMRKDGDKLKPNDLDVCHFAANPALLTETLAGMKDVENAHFEIGQLIHVQASNDYANFFAVVMPMFVSYEELVLEFCNPQLGPSVWKPGMKKTPPPEPAEAEAIKVEVSEPAQV